jgi:hypothetical protein
MKLYVGDDLHANNNFIALVDRKGKRVDLSWFSVKWSTADFS